MAEAKRLDLLLPHQAHAELAALAGVEEVGGWVGFPRDTLDEIKLAVVEACLNALEYGNGEVRVEMIGRAGAEASLEVCVIDAGPGFDPQTVSPPQLDAKLSSPRKRGWGLELMRRLMDCVEIDSRPGHTRIRMLRRRGGQ